MRTRLIQLCSRRQAFTLIEVLVGLSVAAVGFLGAFATVLHSSRLVCAAEEEALVCTGLEQRVDQLRALSWSPLTDGTGVTNIVWAARPECLADIPVTSENITISGYDQTNGQILQGQWPAGASPSVSFISGAQVLGLANAVKVTVSLTWTGRRSSRSQSRSIVTVISRGGISKSALP